MGQKKVTSQEKKEPGTEGTGLILMVSIQMHFVGYLQLHAVQRQPELRELFLRHDNLKLLLAFVLDLITLQSHSIGLLLRCISFFSTITLQHTIMYPLIQKDIDLQIFLSLRNFAHTVQCAYNDM